jgi:transposase
MMKLKEILKGKPYWTTKEALLEIKAHFDIDLSEDQTIKILRDKFHMLFSKPYPMDYRRPINAEALLDNQLVHHNASFKSYKRTRI